MWPILVGFSLGVSIYLFGSWLGKQIGPLYRVINNNYAPRWLRTLLVVLVITSSGLWIVLLMVMAHAYPPLTATLDTGRGWDLFWLVFHSTRFTSGCAGFGLGLLTAAWIVNLESPNARATRWRAISVAVLASFVIVFGLDRNFDFFNRLTKVSAGTVTVELAKAGNAAGKASAPQATTSVVTPPWAATERIGIAFLFLSDLSERAVERDWDVAHFLSSSNWRGTLPQTSDERVMEELRQKAAFFKDVLGMLTVFRETAHEVKRDTNVVFFGSHKLEMVKFAVALRRLIMLDLRSEKVDDGVRNRHLDALSEAFVELLANTRTDICLLKLKVPKGDPSCDLNEDDTAKWSSDQRKQFREKFPNHDTVRNAPYAAIMAATFFYGSGEPEAATSILDEWRRQQSDPKLPKDPKSAEALEANFQAVYRIRVLNVMGAMLADPENALHLELATRYQWSAVKETDKLIGKNTILSELTAKMRFTQKVPSGLVSVATDIVLKRTLNHCPADDPQIPNSVRYFLFRRANQLNNIVFYTTVQPSILENPGVPEQFDAWMNALINTKFDCLAISARLPGTAELVETTRLRNMAGVMDTISRGYFAQAIARRTQPAESQLAICNSYKVAVTTNKLAIADTPQRPDFSDYEAFLAKSFAANGEAAGKVKLYKSTTDYLRTLRAHVEALGEGACTPVAASTAATSDD
jgi:hypothetical protein